MAAPMKNTTLRFALQSNTIFKLLLRNYARGMRQMPVVLSPDQEREKQKKTGVKLADPKTNAHMKYIPDDPVQKTLTQKEKTVTQMKREKHKTIYQQMTSLKQSKSDIKGLQYTKIEDADMSKKFSQVMIRVKSKQEREKRREMVLDTKKLIIDALKSNQTLKALYFSKKELFDHFPTEMITCPVFKVPYKNLKIWSETTTPQGILAIADIPNEGESNFQREEEYPITLVCDQITDPGNMGTLIRTAAAVGCHKVITMKGCVDVWDPKVLRAGAGGHFRVPLINSLSWEYVSNYIPDDSSVFVTDSRRPSDLTLDNITSPEFDVSANADVLNTEDNEEFLEEDDETDLTIDKSFLAKRRLEMYEKVPLNVSLYSEVNYTSQNHTVLIVSGENQNISVQTRKLAFDKYGQCVMLPMAMGISSLNASISGSILLYEIHKQYSEMGNVDSLKDS